MLNPIPDDQWPSAASHLLSDFAGKLNVYRVMAHHPKLLLSWENFRNHVVLHSALTGRQRELVILRASYRWDSSYEWTHHVERGQAVGLTREEIESVRGVSMTPFGPLERGLLIAVDQLLDDGKLSEDTLHTLSEHLGAEGVLDVLATVGMYSTLAFILKTFDTPLESDFAEKMKAK